MRGLGDFRLGGGDLRPAIPFLVMYGCAFLFSGVSVRRVVFLLYAFLYPGFTEEFLDRGGLQQFLLRISKSASAAVTIAALLFAAAYIPDFAFRAYRGALPLAIGNVADAAVYGVFLGYGVHMFGMLWPWMVIHALSDVVGW